MEPCQLYHSRYGWFGGPLLHLERYKRHVMRLYVWATLLTLLCPVSLQYMEKEEAMNVLQFWLAGDNFQNQLAAKKGQYDGQEAQNDAMILYDK